MTVRYNATADRTMPAVEPFELEQDELDAFLPKGISPASDGTPSSEITLRAVVLGAILAVVLGAANVYLGLFAGLTVSASIPASILSMSILRSLFPDVGILENNAVQTGASAGEALAAGVIFTFPALLILGDAGDGGLAAWRDIHYAVVVLISICGGVMGIMFSIPIRRALILETEPPLAFPEGVACANVLLAGEAGSGASAGIVLRAASVAAALKGLQGANVASEVVGTGFIAQKAVVYCSGSISSALFGVGYIVGWKISLVFLIGGVCNWLVFIPIGTLVGVIDSSRYSLEPGASAHGIYSDYTRFLGVGAMLVGGLHALFTLRGALMKGVAAGAAAFRSGAGMEATREQDIPLPICATVCFICVVPFYIIISIFLDDWIFTIFLSAFVIVFGFFASSVAAYMAGLVGSSNNPISGVTICVVLVTALIFYAYLGTSDVAPAAVIYVSAMIACAGSISGDNMQDLKTGHILGATPWKQQLMLIGGVVTSAVVMPFILSLLNGAYGFGISTDSQGPKPLPAPQASLMASVALGVIRGGLPWAWVGAGAVTAVFVIGSDWLLVAYNIPFTIPVLAFSVGFYLPLSTGIAMMCGAVVAYLSGSSPGRESSAGVLFAGGLITGEALMGIALAVPIVMSGDPNVLHVLDEGLWYVSILTTPVVLYSLYRSALLDTTDTKDSRLYSVSVTNSEVDNVDMQLEQVQ